MGDVEDHSLYQTSHIDERLQLQDQGQKVLQVHRCQDAGPFKTRGTEIASDQFG